MQSNFCWPPLESFRFEDKNEDEDEAPGFRHKEIFKLFRLQLGRDNVVAINFVVPAKLKTKKFKDFVVVKTSSPSSSNLKLSIVSWGKTFLAPF